ncbi:translocation/assembly module TamB domain-containing protein [Parasphaerochaeta coccoides]|uniref:Translocation and assembly module TamB C-terminal domain-containing protein n=1 Tax=Parasphaerochaeta coccoides (strain ATCC BAA-1237 / DSM 17374 / SPN1) TaxID=760011 RepID=F4GK44_PARC1|nr:translocation/assembly module TamB domain-containing protein [Parasphaerochaeta coccoides]AEC01816.1 protein of unknown function DUF490 [Parasphaerochaeta coccoides DSM 17374]
MKYRQTFSSITTAILIFSVCFVISVLGVYFFNTGEVADPLATLVTKSSVSDGRLRVTYGYVKTTSSTVEMHEIIVAGNIDGQWMDFLTADSLRIDRSFPDLAGAFVSGHGALKLALESGTVTISPRIVSVIMDAFSAPRDDDRFTEMAESTVQIHKASLFSGLSLDALIKNFIANFMTNSFSLDLTDFNAIYTGDGVSAGLSSLDIGVEVAPSFTPREITFKAGETFLDASTISGFLRRLDAESITGGIRPDESGNGWVVYQTTDKPHLEFSEGEISSYGIEARLTMDSFAPDIISFTNELIGTISREQASLTGLLDDSIVQAGEPLETEWNLAVEFSNNDFLLDGSTAPYSFHLSEATTRASRSDVGLNIDVHGKGSVGDHETTGLSVDLPGTMYVSTEEFRFSALVSQSEKITIDGELAQTGISLDSSVYAVLEKIMGINFSSTREQIDILFFKEASAHVAGTSLNDMSALFLTDLTIKGENEQEPILGGTVSLSYETKEARQAWDVRLISFESSLLPSVMDASVIVDITGSHTYGDILISSSNGFFGRAGYRNENDSRTISARIDFTDFDLAPFADFLHGLIPASQGMIDDATSVAGSLRADAAFAGDSWVPDSGNVIYEISVVELGVGNRVMNIATSAAISLGNGIFTVDTFSLTTEGYRLVFSGWIPFDRRAVPVGRFAFKNITQDEDLVDIGIGVLGSDGYTLDILFPQIPELSIRGEVDLAGIGTLVGSGVLTAWEQKYPTDLFLDYRNLNARLSSAGLGMVTSLSGGEFFLGLDFSSFAVPSFGRPELSDRTVTVDGKMTFILPLNGFNWDFTADSLIVDNIPIGGRFGQFKANIAAVPMEFIFSDVFWKDDSHEPLSGYGMLRLGKKFPGLTLELVEDLELVVNLAASASDEVFIASLAGKNSGTDKPVIGGMIHAQGIDMERFTTAFPGVTFEFNALGTYSLGNAGTDVDAVLRFHKNELSEDGGMLSAVIKLDDSGILLSDVAYESENMSVALDGSIMPGQGHAQVAGNMQFLRETVMEPWISSFGFSSDIRFAPTFDNLPSLMATLFQGNVPADSVSAVINIKDAVLFSQEMLGSTTLSLSYENQILTLQGTGLTDKTTFSRIEGSYALDGEVIDVSVTPGTYPLGFKMRGHFGEEISLEIDELSAPLRLLTYLMAAPILVFHDGIATGKLLVYGPKDNVDVFGQFTADRLDLTSFWTPWTKASAKNPLVILSEGTLSSGKVPVIFTNMITGETAKGYTVFEADLGFRDYSILLGAEDALLPVSFPIPGLGLVISGNIRGALTFSGIPNGIAISGSGFVSDTTVDFELPDDLPAWYLRPSRTNLDLDLITERNVSFSFPNADNPILEANIQPGQNIKIHLDEIADEFSLTGSADIRSGTIYYFRKDFYITEGTLSFPERLSGSGTGFSPVIDLRAKIREYDSDGNAVDVFLILDKASLDNLNPRFESVPAKSSAEILQLMGENFLGSTTGAGDATLSSVASLAAAATDVFSRMGFFDIGTSFGLSRSIKQSLGLDMFSIRSNIVQNVFFDALSLSGYSVPSVASPMARYFDDTSLFFGKFLSNDLFLQGTIHLTARDQYETNARRIRFVNDDLWIDTELSLEWTTPLATFTIFTQPTELSLFGIWDTIGISVTKRLEW